MQGRPFCTGDCDTYVIVDEDWCCRGCGAVCVIVPECDHEARIRKLEAMNTALGAALWDFYGFDISMTFDAKGSYSERKRDELNRLKQKHRAAIDAAREGE